jgi:predicted HicB family RNase H-like nuclease
LETDHAIKWMEKHCNTKITDYVQVPEAGEPSTTLTLRLDTVLKICLNAAAVQEGISMNLWCVRALEAAMKQHEQSGHA